MINLEDALGLPVVAVKAQDGYRLEFQRPLLCGDARPRHIRDIREVLKNKKADTPDVLYWIYRNVRLQEHESLIAGSGLRYDVSIYNPDVMCVGGRAGDGEEFIKAVGHYHPYPLGKRNTFPEVYEIAYGRVLFILQEVEDIFALPMPSNLKRVLFVEAKAGDKLVIPPNCGHAAVNIGCEMMVMSNWVAGLFDSQYAPYKRVHGAAYYIVKKGEGWEYEPNPNYDSLMPPNMISPADLDNRGIPTDRPIYWSFIEEPHLFSFLLEP